MELLIKKRSPIRGNFTKTYNALTKLLAEENPKEENIKVNYANLERIYQSLTILDNEICDMLIDTSEQQKYDDEYNAIEEYNEKMVSAKVNFELFLAKNASLDRISLDGCSLSTKRKLKLPKIELVKFSSELKDWLSFWSQFKRIHEDNELENEDKFQYLIQCISKGTRAREIIDSFPPTSENYKKAIESLKSRFGRDELLIEFYVRQLLQLVVQNAKGAKNKINTSSLYDKLESYLRALESIGLTSDKYAAMLFPLVESCIPEDVFRVWLRNPGAITDDSSNNVYSTKLKSLLAFLKTEVEGDERIRLAQSSFENDRNHETTNIDNECILKTDFEISPLEALLVAKTFGSISKW
ncbi:uncharacterized protein [Parasteatoda tepidariorum]|uniref:uncharacterized protein n=1 Tax=Parasteatoda tepidariorum TaxID=114398 RepID=UPI0039BD1FFA